ncbi:MAG: glycerol-3-phosphate 1-O-acyltransferase PlsY [Candidatus Aminicenantes bacterium]|nr:glycerol-3-phosphate 1-O-acyltransferase PlsY [Candidatus Aminicenantes bacterium]
MKIAFALGSYLLGAVPSGYLLVRLRARRDIRSLGSGNTGATNVLRIQGWKAALPVALFDVVKGALPPFLALRLFHDERLALIAALLAVLGHCYPVYIGFRGGKGVATTLGALLIVGWWTPFAVALAVFAGTLALTRFVSLGSLLAALSVPVSSLVFNRGRAFAAWGLALFVLIAIRHRENIGRLLRGEERRLGRREGGQPS